MYDVQTLFENIGAMGLSQILFCIYLTFGKMWIVYINNSSLFTNYSPDYRCEVPPLDDNQLYPNLTELDIVNYTTKYDEEEQKYDFCSRYGYNTSGCINGSLSCVDVTLPTIPCDHGYKYDTSVMKITAVTKFDLVCDRLFLNSLSTSMFFLGMLVASIIFGNLADNYGRRKVLIFGELVFIGGTIANISSPNVSIYIITRFILSLGNHGSEIVLTVYASELTTYQTRTLFFGMINVGVIIGQLLLPGASYYWNIDNAVLLVAVLGTAPFAILAFVVSESPRWLLATNKTDQAKQAIKRMGKINGRPLTEEDFNKAKIPCEPNAQGQEEQDGKRKSFIDLFNTREMSKIVLLVSLNWFSCTFVYYGITLNAGALSGNIFLNTALNTLMEGAAYLLIFFTMDRFGRRKLLAYSHLIAGFGLLANMSTTLIFPNNRGGALLVAKVLAFIAKFGISFGFGIVYQYTNELFPTELRSNGFGLCTTLARIGSLFAPFLIDLQQIIIWLPNTIFGAIAIIAGFSTFLLPDTVGVNLLQNEEEAVYFYKNWRSMRKNNVADKKSKIFVVNDTFELNEDK